jgi:very-short-patch-repair endonuclease
VFTGPLPPLTRIWAAILYARPSASASHDAAGWLQELRPDLPVAVDVCVPHGRRHRGSRPGIKVHQSRHLATRRHPARLPPQTRLEETVLDLCDGYGRDDDVIDVALRACQRRLTTAARLRKAAAGRRRMRWRALVRDLLADVVDGVQSALERRYRDDVERPHALPRGQRNLADGPRGRRRYRDVRYRKWRVVVELDGRAAHPEEWQESDDLRDNAVAETERTQTLRYGWRSVTSSPCLTAQQVVAVLRREGWTGSPHRCGPGCSADFGAADV